MTKKRINPTHQLLLEIARQKQTEFWGALRKLEQELKTEIDGTNDLNDWEIHDLMREPQADADDPCTCDDPSHIHPDNY